MVLLQIRIDMLASIVSRETKGEEYLMLRISIPSCDQALFGALLDSMEGIGNHTEGENTDEIKILTSVSREAEFICFLNAWMLFNPRCSITTDIPILPYDHNRSMSRISNV